MTNPVSPSRPQRRNRVLMAGGPLLLTVAMVLGLFTVTRAARSLLPPKPPARLAAILSQTIQAKGLEAAAAQYRELRERGFRGLHESESDTNGLAHAENGLRGVTRC